MDYFLFIIGFGLLFVSGHFLVIIAFETSVPELATSIIAALKIENVMLWMLGISLLLLATTVWGKRKYNDSMALCNVGIYYIFNVFIEITND